MSDEKSLWRCSPSQLVNIKSFVLYGFLAILLLVAIYYSGTIVESLIEKGSVTAERFTRYLSLFFLTMFFISLIIIFIKYLQVKMTVYEQTTQRLRYSYGILSKTTEELELYRIKDISLQEPFIQRIVGLGCIHIVSSDKSHPEFEIKAVRGTQEKRDILRENVERLRTEKRVREVDFE